MCLNCTSDELKLNDETYKQRPPLPAGPPPADRSSTYPRASLSAASRTIFILSLEYQCRIKVFLPDRHESRPIIEIYFDLVLRFSIESSFRSPDAEVSPAHTTIVSDHGMPQGISLGGRQCHERL